MGVTGTGARLLAAAVLALVPTMLTSGVGAQQLPPAPGTSDTSSGTADTADTSDQDPDGRIQILGVEEGDDAVTLDVAVPAAFGPLAPIDRNFGLTDGGHRVDLAVAPLGAAADTMLALDTSGSMRGPALEAAKAAARTFVRTVSPDTRVGLETFGDSVVIRQEPTLDRDSLLAALDGITTADGDTALWDALVTAADLVGSGTGRASVVVLSDGDNTVGTASQAVAIEHLRSRSTILYAVAIESPDADLGALQVTVDQVGGQYLATTDIGEFESLYTEIAGRLANRYQLTFAPAQHGTRTAVVSVAASGTLATAHITLHGTGTIGIAPTPGAGAPAAPGTGAPAAPTASPPVMSTPARWPWSGSLLFWVGNGSVFGALTLLGLLVARSSPQVQLVTVTSADRVAGLHAQLGQAIDRLVSRHDSQRRLDARLDAAGLDLRPGELVLIWIVASVGTIVAATALGGPALSVAVVPLPTLAVLFVLRYRAGRRRSRFADQLTATLAIMANSLRAGQSLRQAVELVATEAPSPTAEQFHRIHFEIRVGRDLTESMREVARRMDNPDMEWLAQAVDIHRELGGDLTEILQNLAATLRERRSVARQVDALSAEGRATGMVLLAMPIVLFLFSWWRTPNSINRMLSEPLGRLLLLVAVAGMTAGHLWIRRLVNVKY